MYPVLTPSHRIGSLFTFTDLSTGYVPQKSNHRNAYTHGAYPTRDGVFIN